MIDYIIRARTLVKSALAACAAGLIAMTLLAYATPAFAQYNSGSSGVHGVFPPAPLPANIRYLLWDLKTGLLRFCSAYDTTLRPDTCTTELGTAQIPGIPAGGLTTGIYEFSSFDVANVAPNALDIYPVGHDGPTPLTILSATSFRLRANVFLRLDGGQGQSSSVGLQPSEYGTLGGRPGPGGFAGGAGGKQGSPSTNGSPGFGPTGGSGGLANQANSNGLGGHATPTPVATSLIPLVGGSGGGGSAGFDTACGFRGAGGGGGGGGGAVLIAASSQIILDNSSGITARGSIGGAGCFGFRGGSGSGGSVRIVATSITGNGLIAVETGIVRVEGNASTYTGSIDSTRGTVLGAPQPALGMGFPVLRITSVGGIPVGQSPSGSVSTPDVTFQAAPVGPVPVELAAANIPSGTTVNLRAIPAIGAATTATSSALVGTTQSSTANASLTIPPGAGVITAVTSFPATVAFLDQLPAIPGLTPKTIEVAADASGGSRTFVVGEDERRVEIVLAANGRIALAP